MWRWGGYWVVAQIKAYKANNMINNYLEYEYRPSNKIYTHEETGKSIHLGDISAALDLDFINRECISTGTPSLI
jgi:hypothetical protein